MELNIKGFTVLIDDEDALLIQKNKWYKLNKRVGQIYFGRMSKNRKCVLLHREILGLKHGDGFKVDHINGDTLDNRKVNLRICNTSENARNQKRNNRNTTGYKGVSYHKKSGKYSARITADGKLIWLGLFDTPKQAYKKYCEASKMYHGVFGRVI